MPAVGGSTGAKSGWEPFSRKKWTATVSGVRKACQTGRRCLAQPGEAKVRPCCRESLQLQGEARRRRTPGAEE